MYVWNEFSWSTGGMPLLRHWILGCHERQWIYCPTQHLSEFKGMWPRELFISMQPLIRISWRHQIFDLTTGGCETSSGIWPEASLFWSSIKAVIEYTQTFAVKTSISLQLTFLLHRFIVLHIDYYYLCCNFVLSSNISNNVFVCHICAPNFSSVASLFH